VVVGVYIVNGKGEVLLIRSPKWNNKLVPPGGHVELGENINDAIIRETREEVGLRVRNPEFLTVAEEIFSEEFSQYKGHFICLEYKVELDEEDHEIKLDSREASEHLWLKPKDIVQRNDVEKLTKEVIEEYFIKIKEKKSLFQRDCEHCEKYKKEAEEFKFGWKRALADYRNLQKEIEERKSDWLSMSEQQILEEFLPVYDNFKKSGTTNLPSRIDTNHEVVINGLLQRWQNWKQGIEYIMKQFGDVLRAHGFEEIKTVGDKFDPKYHEAIGEEEAEGKKPHTIIREMDGGYMMKGRVVKPARVVVAKGI